ncbi:MAG TPA: hypothetical protein VFW02_11615 [Candidatus Limnocylindrales bacterium]|nr:hypothetical protein [Candidatus Limnocylindrales bacterium]
MTTTEAEATARARVDYLLERMSRVDLQVVVVAPPDATRLVARERARNAAAAAGLATLFDEATRAARETTLRAFARGGFSGTWAVTDWSISVASGSDRAAAAAAFEEAAMAAVVEDLADEETLEVLRATTIELERATGMPPPGALSALSGRFVAGPLGPVRVAGLVLFVLLGTFVGGMFGGTIGLLAFGLVVAVAAMAQRRSGSGT